MWQILTNYWNIIRTYKNYWSYLLPITGPNTELVTRKPEYKFTVRKSKGDHWMLDDMFVRKDYNYIFGNQNSYTTAVDIGAHIGCFAIPAASRAKTVICLEPDPETFRLLETNIKNNHFKNLKPLQVALANKSGNISFYRSKLSSGNSSLLKRPGEKIQVPALRIVDLISQQKLKSIDILKIDCEGYEYQLLSSSGASYLKLANCIALEYHPNPNLNSEFDWVMGRMSKLGFELVAAPRQTRDKGVLIFINKQKLK